MVLNSLVFLTSYKAVKATITQHLVLLHMKSRKEYIGTNTYRSII